MNQHAILIFFVIAVSGKIHLADLFQFDPQMRSHQPDAGGDRALCQLQLEGGILASVSADFFRPEGAPTHDDDRIRIVGTKGVLEYMDGKVTLLNAQGSTQLPLEEGEDVFRLFLEDSGITEQDSFYVTELALNLNEAAEP